VRGRGIGDDIDDGPRRNARLFNLSESEKAWCPAKFAFLAEDANRVSMGWPDGFVNLQGRVGCRRGSAWIFFFRGIARRSGGATDSSAICRSVLQKIHGFDQFP